MWVLKILLFAALAYAVVVALIFFAQTALLFPTRMAGASGPLPAGSERLQVEGPGGEKLHGTHVPPARAAAGEKLVILGFGGNAWNADSVAAYLHDLYPAAHVVAFHYRGYAPSSGKPSAAALLADAPLLHDYVADRLGSDRIVVVGFSIGSGVAAHLASRRELAGLILVTPFDSLEALAAGHYRWLPVSLLLRHRMNPAEDLRASRVPVALIAAGGDNVIPLRHARALAKEVPNLVLDRTIAGAGHNDIYERPEFRQAMAEALDKVHSAEP
jgi:pimeloyl-ACP methyl ester carboxylesterase